MEETYFDITRFFSEKNQDTGFLTIIDGETGKKITIIKSDSCKPKFLGCDGNYYITPMQYFNKIKETENE